MSNPQHQLTGSEELEKTLIDLYETAMLHGESQANGVLPPKSQRELAIVLAKREIQARHTKHLAKARLDMQTALDKELEDAERRGSRNRVKWAQDNETMGESYARNQGFKSGLLVAKRVLAQLASMEKTDDK